MITPLATCIPVISSGEVSSLNKITGPSLALFSASSAVKTIVPQAAPGEAFKPLLRSFFSALGSICLCKSWLIPTGSTNNKAWSLSIIPSLYKSTAILTPALAVLLPFLHCKRYNFPSWMVNSISCISLLCFSNFSLTSLSCLYISGMASSIDGKVEPWAAFPAFEICCGVLIPATTSSPWALIKYSPKKTFSPVAGFLVKATPVAEVSPILPNTIATMLTAVPQVCGISLRFL